MGFLAAIHAAILVALTALAPSPAPRAVTPAPPVIVTQQAQTQATAAPIPTQQTYQGGPYLGTALRDALALTPWPPALWPTIEAIVYCESRGQTTAVSPGGHVGLMQVDPRFWGVPPTDAVGQLTQGYGVYVAQGWGAWSCAR